MDSTADELADELHELTRRLRDQLLRHAALGAWAAPGGPTAHNALEAGELDGAPDADAQSASAADPASAVAVATQVGAAPAGTAAPVAAAPVAAAAVSSVASEAVAGSAAASDRSPREPAAIWAGDAAADANAPIVLGRKSLEQIRTELGDCTRCKLSTTRRSIVFGVGAADAQLMFVGEAPGEQEDRRGEPFVGPAGQLLDKMIEAMGWTRDTVYIANTTKCRPPNNRNPQADELAACIPFLHQQIASVTPRVIVALGRPAANQLLEVDAPIGTLRGRFHDYPAARDRHSLQIMPTFHPAYLLRDPDKKRVAWADLKLVIAELERLGITPPRPHA